METVFYMAVETMRLVVLASGSAKTCRRTIKRLKEIEDRAKQPISEVSKEKCSLTCEICLKKYSDPASLSRHKKKNEACKAGTKKKKRGFNFDVYDRPVGQHSTEYVKLEREKKKQKVSFEANNTNETLDIPESSVSNCGMLTQPINTSKFLIQKQDETQILYNLSQSLVPIAQGRTKTNTVLDSSDYLSLLSNSVNLKSAESSSLHVIKKLYVIAMYDNEVRSILYES